MDTKLCPKCQGDMVLGNYTGHQVDWEKEKDPERSFLKQSGQTIDTYACKKCGYMESYVKR